MAKVIIATIAAFIGIGSQSYGRDLRSADNRDLWTRIVSPDGAIAIKVPCKDRDANWYHTKKTKNLAINCNHNGASYSVMIRNPDIEFDDLINAAKKGYGADHVELFSLNGMRAARTVGLRNEFDQFVELPSGKWVLLEVIDQPPGSMPATQRPAMFDIGKRFVASLEVLEK